MNLQVRLCALVLVLLWSASVSAQEDVPFPVDDEAVQPEEPVEPDAPMEAPLSSTSADQTPIGRVEVVEKTPPTETVPDKQIGDVALSAEQRELAEEETAEDRLRTGFIIRSEGVTANNLDFRPLDNETFIDIFDSDDRTTLLFTQLAAAIAYDAAEDTTFTLAASHTGAWGGDSIGAANAFGGVFYVDALNVDWHPLSSDTFGFRATIGRQPFSIGGARSDFFLDDVIDGVVLTTDFGKAGRLRLVPIDLYALQRPDEVSIGAALGYAGPDERYPTVGFDGDTNTMRFGGVYEITKLVEGLAMRVFGFYADIGAGTSQHTGSDRVFNGAHGNFSDNDYNWMGGARIGYDLDGEAFDLGIYGEYARSGGIDRKAVQIGVRDVVANGNAFGGAVTPKIDLGTVALRFVGQFFMADGGAYTGEEGLLYNYGFVGMKGDQIGGLNMSRFAGWHPTAYVGTRGVHFTPQDVSRKSGTMTIHGGVGADLVDKFHIDLGVWYLKDNSTTFLSGFDDLDDIADELPFGYSEADLIPQERLGRPLGIELDATLAYDPSDILRFYAVGGVFMPGSYYEIEIPRTGGTALGAEVPANFWAVLGGASLAF